MPASTHRAAFVTAAVLASQHRALRSPLNRCAATLRWSARQRPVPLRHRAGLPFSFSSSFSSSSSFSAPAQSPAAPQPARKLPRASETTLLRDEVLDVQSPSGAVPVRLCVESLDPRRLRVSGSVRVCAEMARVWRVLTAYPLQSAFIPNLISTTPQRRDGRLYLEQVGLLSRKLQLRSRLVLSVEENIAARTIRLARDSGRDFVEFEAAYALLDVNAMSEADGATVVHGDGDILIDYTVVASPFALYPMSLVERKIVKEVPRMLAAVREEAMVPTHVPCDDVAPTNVA